MKGFRIIICVFLASLVVSTATLKAKEIPKKSPSLLDMPEKGLYYGFIMNNSSHFIEVSIWSVKRNQKVYNNIVLPPDKRSNEMNDQALEYRDRRIDALRPPHVFSLWLQLGTYKLSIRQRNDIADQGGIGAWKTFVVVLDREYIEKSQGPFTLEIEDD